MCSTTVGGDVLVLYEYDHVLHELDLHSSSPPGHRSDERHEPRRPSQFIERIADIVPPLPLGDQLPGLLLLRAAEVGLRVEHPETLVRGHDEHHGEGNDGDAAGRGDQGGGSDQGRAGEEGDEEVEGCGEDGAGDDVGLGGSAGSRLKQVSGCSPG